MAVRFHPKSEALHCLKVGPLGPHIESLANWLSERGFCRDIGWAKVKLAAELSRWLQRRRIKPFEDMEELKRELLTYASSIEKCEDYITMTSRIFTVRVTAVSGVAKASSVIAVSKDGKKVQRIAVVNT